MSLRHGEGAIAGRLKHPHKSTLIHKVVLYVEVQHPIPAWPTQINTSDRILHPIKAVISGRLLATAIADTARATSDARILLYIIAGKKVQMFSKGITPTSWGVC